MNSLDSVRLRADFSATVNRVAFGKERITLTRRGKKVAVLVPVEDARDLRDAPKALKEKGGKTLAQLRKELGL